MPRPNFFIAGAPKCGTTALWQFLRQHPDIFLTHPIKEPQFFSSRSDLDFTWYGKLFQDVKNEKIIGEATTTYFWDNDSAKLIKRYLPKAKIVISLRNPIDLMYSFYWQAIKDGHELPPFKAILDDHPRFTSLNKTAHFKKNLRKFYQEFPKDQILILTQEDLHHRPQQIMQQIFKFLVVKDLSEKIDYTKRYNPHFEPRFPRLQQLRKKVTNFLILSRSPKSLIDLLCKFRRKFARVEAMLNKPGQYPKLDPALRQKLIPLFLEDIEYVEKLLNRDLSHWKK